MKRIFTLFYLIIFPLLAYCQDENNEYYSISINTGDKPECIHCKTIYDFKLDNFLRIDATGSSDLVLKVINNKTGDCIRSVFISGGSIYNIVSIPEGIYYLKIAYGYNWSKKVLGSFCFAKFITDAHYQVGNDLLDFNIKHFSEGYQVPSFELLLKVITNNRNGEFDAENISEDEFYK